MITAIKTFLNTIDNNINYSKGTKIYYHKHCIIINNWLLKNGIKTLIDLNYSDVIDFIIDQQQNLSATTINRRVGIIKIMLESVAPGNADLSKINKIGKLTIKHRNYQILTEVELKKIIKYINSLSDTENNNLMYKTLVLLLIDTGARINEILNIKKKNVNLNNFEILLDKTKTNVDRFVFIHKGDTVELLKKIIKENTESEYLLFNLDKSRQANYDDVRYIMKKIKKELNIKTLNSYMFRHTFGTRLVENGADLFSIKKIMGHANISTTQLYIHLSKKHVQKTYNKTHIR